MPIFTPIKNIAGRYGGKFLVEALKAIGSNFALLEPAVANHNAAGNRNLVVSDKVIRCNNAGAQTVTVPTNANAGFAIGSRVEIIRAGAGTVTIAAAGGVTIEKVGAKPLTVGPQGGVAYLRKTDTNVWNLSGDLA